MKTLTMLAVLLLAGCDTEHGHTCRFVETSRDTVYYGGRARVLRDEKTKREFLVVEDPSGVAVVEIEPK